MSVSRLQIIFTGVDGTAWAMLNWPYIYGLGSENAKKDPNFKAIFDDFRQSYVLQYSPAGVKGQGWHALAVTVPSAKDATIRARQGYYGV